MLVFLRYSFSLILKIFLQSEWHCHFLVYLCSLWLFLLKPLFLYVRVFSLLRWSPSYPSQNLLLGQTSLLRSIRLYLTIYWLSPPFPYWNCHFPLVHMWPACLTLDVSFSVSDHIPKYPRKTNIPAWFFSLFVTSSKFNQPPEVAFVTSWNSPPSVHFFLIALLQP